VFYYKGAKMQ
jgi:ribosome-interacting GTPase 1